MRPKPSFKDLLVVHQVFHRVLQIQSSERYLTMETLSARRNFMESQWTNTMRQNIRIRFVMLTTRKKILALLLINYMALVNLLIFFKTYFLILVQ